MYICSMNFLLFILFFCTTWDLYGQKDAYELLKKAGLNKNNPDKALEILGMSEKLFLMSNNKNGLLEIEKLKAELHDIKGNKTEVYISLKQLEKISNELNNIETHITSYKLLFDFFIRLEMFDSALVYCDKIEKLGQEQGLSEDITNLNGYLGSFYIKLKNYTAAKDYLLKSLKLKSKSNYNTGLYSDIGNVYYYLNNLDSAFYYYEVGYQFAKNHKDTMGMAYTLNNKGLYYKSIQKYDKAIEFFNQAIDFYEIINNRYGIMNSFSNIAQIYILQKQFHKAIEIALTYFQEAKENEFFELVMEFSKILAESYEKINNYEKSVLYYKELLISSDTIYQKKFKMLSSDYNHKQRIFQQKLIDNDINREFNLWFFLFWILLILNILFVIFYVFRKKIFIN